LCLGCFENIFTKRKSNLTMKKIIIISIIALVAFLPFKKANAQYTIPSYDVQVTANTTFEDSGFTSQDEDREERWLTVEVEDEHRGGDEYAWSVITIYPLGGGFSMGPFLVLQDMPFQMNLNDEDWGVKVIIASEDCKMSVWED
jgi:hypothetical protein